jgi:hypothetical protein
MSAGSKVRPAQPVAVGRVALLVPVALPAQVVRRVAQHRLVKQHLHQRRESVAALRVTVGLDA